MNSSIGHESIPSMSSSLHFPSSANLCTPLVRVCLLGKFVNEEGSEAAAASAFVMMLRCMSNPDFVANRPFLYGIFRGEEPIFIGQFC
ncbi:unnamed protein product [Heligmosomoides polygyrus]|uniref:SERPIN domain-containing protein n=1 Tax=Heligmosomoides polygyrus TaxID=6339 RepID=A0A3P8BTH5_HELPZ|nr:unnamed protein product [Heligmosomoides polygyrus]